MIKRIARKVLTQWLWGYTPAELGMGQITWSQFGEDCLVRNMFPKDYSGCYVDVGAFHPIYLSNTYKLYKSGWRGLAIDANPHMAPLFDRLRPGDTFVHSAVGLIPGLVTMKMFDVGAFNCLEQNSENVPSQFRGNVQSLRVPSKPLSALLLEHGIEKIDFLNVDCEGSDLEILESNDWMRWKPSVVCVEDHSKEWKNSLVTSFLNERDYVLITRACLSSLFSIRR